MQILETIFRLGVILAIFGFIWAFIQLGLVLLTGGANKGNQTYTLRGIKYFFMVQVLALFCFDEESSLSLSSTSVVITSLILFFYLVGQIENRKRRKQMFSLMTNGRSLINNEFSQIGEVSVLAVAIGAFVLFLFYPEWAQNSITNWFKVSIMDMGKAPIFGFIFRIVGFFFLLSIFNRAFQSFMILFGIKKASPTDSEDKSNRGDDHFDDFEEIS
jgi:hypothetical protein